MYAANTPELVIDLDIAERNCRNISAGLREYGIAWRPHIKTHKSVFLAKKQQEWGAKGITCAKLGEAEVMADAGFQDIYLAYPVIGEEKISRYFALSQSIAELKTLVNDVTAGAMLGRYFAERGKRAKVLLEVDGRFGRGGVPLAEFREFACAVKELPGLQIVGVASFCGNSSHMFMESERRADAKTEAGDLVCAKKVLDACGIEAAILSSGSSVSSRYPDCLDGITESRAGTCIFNDMTHVSLGTVGISDCAVTILTTVITLPQKGKAIIDAGSKTLSSDTCKREGYGYILEYPEIVISKLSEEHGFLDLPDDVELKIGEVLHIIPNHVCVTINLADCVTCVKKGQEPFTIPIDARGKNR